MKTNIKELTEANCSYSDSNLNLNNCSVVNLYNIKIKSSTTINCTGSNLLDLQAIKTAEKSITININNSMKGTITNIKEAAV